MIIRFLTPDGKVVDSPYDFGTYKTPTNFPFYLRVKLLELNYRFPRLIEKYRSEFIIDPSFLTEKVLIPIAGKATKKNMTSQEYLSELKRRLNKYVDINIDELDKLIKTELSNIYLYKNPYHMVYPFALMEIVLFGITRVVDKLPDLDISVTLGENEQIFNIHIRKDVGITELKEFIELHYDATIKLILDGTKIEKQDKFKVSKRNLEIIRLYKHKKLPYREIVERLKLQAKYSEEVARNTISNYKKIANS